jgi:hypothetical protein
VRAVLAVPEHPVDLVIPQSRLRLLRGRFEPHEDLLNRAAPVPELIAEPVPEPTSVVDTARRYDALTSGMIGFLAICLVLGVVCAWRLKPESLGDYLKMSVDAKSARARADEIMRGRGLDPNSFHHATVFQNMTDSLSNEFLRERVGITRLNEIYATQAPGAVWQVRYFRDSQPEEYSIKLKPDGSFLALHHKLAEDAPGASLSKDEAVTRAEKFLREEKKLDLSQWTLVDAESDKRHHRTDHELTWQQNTPLDSVAATSMDALGHAYVRIKVAVLGDEVTDYRGSYYSKPDSREELEQNEGGTYWIFIKIPDDWRRKQQELTGPRTVLSYGIPILFYLGGGIAVLIIFLTNLRSEAARAIPWTRISRWAVWALAAYLLAVALGDRIPATLNAYNSAIPLKTTLGILAMSILLSSPFVMGAVALLFALAWYFTKRSFGEEQNPELRAETRAVNGPSPSILSLTGRGEESVARVSRMMRRT